MRGEGVSQNDDFITYALFSKRDHKGVKNIQKTTTWFMDDPFVEKFPVNSANIGTL